MYDDYDIYNGILSDYGSGDKKALTLEDVIYIGINENDCDELSDCWMNIWLP